MIGCCEVLFDSSAQAFLPLIVRPAQLGRANGYLFAAEVVAGSIVGLSIGALLFDAGVGLPFAINAASFAVAAALIATIRRRTRAATSRRRRRSPTGRWVSGCGSCGATGCCGRWR